MFITDKLIYIQMHKTACTHIASLLDKVFSGVQVGKHNAASDDQINSDIYFLSSIRNPWEWYLSLWAYGVQGNGALMYRLTNDYYCEVEKLVSRNPSINHFAILNKVKQDVLVWRNVYDDSGSVESFRKWLKLIHIPNNAHWLGEGYGKSTVKEFCGFMSYRFLYLCCAKPDQLKTPNLISNYTELVQYEKNACYIDFFIRQESLEINFCQAVEKIRPLKQEEKDQIWGANKTNTSKRPFAISHYYNQESIDLISSRESLLIDKFDYAPPNS